MVGSVHFDGNVLDQRSLELVVSDLLRRFMRESPVTVMARAVLERAFPDQVLDQMFKRTARRQYEDKLLFSTVVKVLSAVVLRGRKSVREAYLAEQRAQAQATLAALYIKLQNTETAVVAGLVRESFVRLAPLMRGLKASRQPLFPGYCTKILDGAHLTGTQHRLRETRTLHSSPLPGQALVVLQPDQRLISAAFPCEDAHAQERSLLDQVLATIEERDLVLADRNFCTTEFLFGLARGRACFLIRQHATTLWGKELLGKRRRRGRCAGGVVYEQTMRIIHPLTDEQLLLRRITIVLDQPTTDGDTEIHLLSNLPQRFGAVRLAGAYLERWRVENAFQEIEQALRGEVNTLGYPKAALLAFGIALLIYNVIAVVKGALQAQHGAAAAFDNLSGYCLASEIAAVHAGMMIAIPPADWTALLAGLPVPALVQFLTQTAAYANPKRFAKSPRGPKKPPPKRSGGLREKHVSTHRLLLARKPIPLATTL
jgi:DDE family transposase